MQQVQDQQLLRVTLNKLCGNVTMFSGSVATQTSSNFKLTNSFIASTDMVLVRDMSSANGGAWNISVIPYAGSASVIVRNISSGTITEATPLNFIIIKSVTS